MKRKLLLLILILFVGTYGLKAQCQHSVELVDEWGDGWNGGSLTISVNGTAVLTDITLASGAGPEVHYFTANTGDDIDADYTAGSFSYENEYTVKDGGGTILDQSGQGGATPVDILDMVGNCPSCPPPTGQTETSLTTTGANLGWTDATGSHWDVYVVATGDPAPIQTTTPTANDITTNPYTYNGGSINTTYDWYVRSDCDQDNTGTSDWTGPSTFSTLPGPHSFPLTEDFESGFTYFDNAVGNDVDFADETTLYHGGTHSVHNAYGASNSNILHETGILDLSGTSSAVLEFWQIAKTEGGYDKCYIEVSTDGGANYTALPSGSYQGSGTGYDTDGYFDEDDYGTWGTGSETPDNTWWKKETFSLADYNTTNVRFRFRLTSDGGVQRDGWYIDDINIYEPSCSPPSALTETSITTTGADFGWTDALGSHWDIYVVATGDPAPIQTTTPTANDITTNPYTYSGGSANTTYDWYVRSDCDQDNTGTSDWTGPSTFSTLPGPHSFPLTEDFESGFTYFDNAVGNDVDFADETTLYHGGTHSVHNAYGASNSNILHETGILDLSGTSGAVLEFWQIAKTENNWDKCYIEVSTDGGANYTALPSGTYQGSGTGYGTDGYFDEGDYTAWGTTDVPAENTWWKKETFSLASYNTTNVRFRFKLTSDGSGQRNGWYIDDINIYEPSCPAPSTLTEASITTSGADLGWTDAAGSHWDVYVVPTGDPAPVQGTTPTANDITTNPYTYNVGSSATTYDWYVRSDCDQDNTGTSDWTGPSTFTTLCEAIDAFDENFDAITPPAFPVCWGKVGTGGSASTQTSNPNTSPNTLYMYSSSTSSLAVVKMQPVSNFGAGTHRLSFNMRANYSVGGVIEIGYLTDPDDAATFTSLGTVTASSTTYAAYTFSPPSGTYSEHPAFRHTGDPGNSLLIDDVVWEEIPSCPDPTALTSTNETAVGADLGWTDDSGSHWDLYIVPTGDPAPDAATSPTVNDYALTSYTWSDGNAGTTYDWYVRSDCGGDNTDVSPWAGPDSFSTIPGNDNCGNATNLIVGYVENWTLGTNAGATESNNNPDPIPAPGCASYSGGDVWYSATVPASGYMVITCQGVTGSSLSDGGMAYYTGSCGALVLGECDDDDGVGTFPEIVINDVSLAGQTVYIRFWEYGNNAYGDFEITAYTISTTCVWTGNTDNDWHTAGNWDNGVPGFITNVTIPGSGITNYPTLSAAGECNNLTIQNNASLIGAEYLTVNGTTTVERYVTGGQWHNIASPVDDPTLNALYSDTYNVWVDEYTESSDSWSSVTELTTPFPFGKGFNYWVQAAGRANLTVEFQGDLRTSDLTLNTGSTPALSFTDASHGYNFVGNPFSSALNWTHDDWTKTNIDGSIWIYSNGAWITSNASGVGGITGGIIPLGQGFFVLANAASPELTMPLTARVHSTTGYYAPENGGDENSTREVTYQSAIFTISNSQSSDQTWVIFSNEATEGYDNGWDTYKLFGDEDSPQLYLVENELELTVDALPELIDETRIVNMSLKSGVSGDQTLNADLSNLENIEVILEDLKLETMQSLTDNPVYNFTAAYYQDPARFRLYFNRIVTDIKENIGDKPVIYSNDGAIYIKCNGKLAESQMNVSVVDMFGRTVIHTKTAGSTLTRIPVNINNAYFIVKVISDGQVYTSKVFIK